MNKFTMACFLLGLTVTPEAVESLTAEEKKTILQLVGKEYGVNVVQTSEAQLMSMARKLGNTRYFNHIFEGGCLH